MKMQMTIGDHHRSELIRASSAMYAADNPQGLGALFHWAAAQDSLPIDVYDEVMDRYREWLNWNWPITPKP